MEPAFRVNEEECAAQVIDGEAVIINLLNGTYYSLDKVGGAIWERAAAGRTVPEILEEIITRYDVERERAARDIERLTQELLAERLLVPAPPSLGANDSAGQGETGAASNPTARLPYDEPALTTYRDMAELLALDPPMPRLETLVWSEPADDKAAKRPA